jgi:dihydroorotase
MKLIIKEIKKLSILKSSFVPRLLDILVEEGFITRSGTSLINPNNLEELKLPNLHISQGWFDSSISTKSEPRI